MQGSGVTGKTWLWLAQGALVVLVGVFVWQALEGHWQEFRTLDLAFRPRIGPILAAVGAVLGTYGLLIGAWRGVLLGWGQHLGYRPAARIWCLSNLGRYLPGKVWSIAGLAVLAQRAGVAGWAAVGSAVVLQALAVATGAVVVALMLPGMLAPLQVGIAVVLGAGTVAALSSERVAARLVRRVAPSLDVRALPWQTALGATAITLLSWVAYGTGFWLLARGLVASPLPLGAAWGIFAAGYIVGLLALIAPGGVGVREAMLVGLLVPVVGSGDAVILTVGSRLLLTVTEAGAALGALVLDRGFSRGVA